MPKLHQPSLYVGIDPGKSGGLAAMGPSWQATADKMPSTERDAWQWFVDLPQGDVFACIERVGGYMPGSAGNIGSAMFSFGQNYGMLRAFLVASDIPFEEVSPRTWQKAVGITPRKKEEGKPQFKNRIKSVAQRLFPSVKLTLATCDAILIAEYCRRKREGKL